MHQHSALRSTPHAVASTSARSLSVESSPLVIRGGRLSQRSRASASSTPKSVQWSPSNDDRAGAQSGGSKQRAHGPSRDQTQSATMQWAVSTDAISLTLCLGDSRDRPPLAPPHIPLFVCRDVFLRSHAVHSGASAPTLVRRITAAAHSLLIHSHGSAGTMATDIGPAETDARHGYEHVCSSAGGI